MRPRHARRGLVSYSPKLTEDMERQRGGLASAAGLPSALAAKQASCVQAAVEVMRVVRAAGGGRCRKNAAYGGRSDAKTARAFISID